MFAKAVGVVAVALSACGVAYGASGSLTDPKGDSPDIVRLEYANADARVIMTMTLAGGHAQNESFYMRWGAKAQHYYQVFFSPAAKMRELRYSGKSGKVACKGMVIKRPTARSTKVTVPRSCLGKAPNKLRFQGVATEGLFSADETKTSKEIARG